MQICIKYMSRSYKTVNICIGINYLTYLNFFSRLYLFALPVRPVYPAEGLEPEQEVVLQDVTLQDILIPAIRKCVTKRLTLSSINHVVLNISL